MTVVTSSLGCGSDKQTLGWPGAQPAEGWSASNIRPAGAQPRRGAHRG